MFAMLTVANCCKKFNFDNGQGHQIQKVVIIMKEKRQRFIFYSTFNPFLFANEHTEMKLKIYLSEAWMCSEFGMLITDVERERVKILTQVR